MYEPQPTPLAPPAPLPESINPAEALPIVDACRLFRGRGGLPPHYRIVLRWSDPAKGRIVNGRKVVLRAVGPFRDRQTTRAWVEEFLTACGLPPAGAGRGEVLTLAGLEAKLRREMYEPGCPPQLGEEAARADARVVARMRCPGCSRRRMEYHPWHRGRAYRALAGCPECGAAEEV